MRRLVEWWTESEPRPRWWLFIAHVLMLLAIIKAVIEVAGLI